MPTHRFENVKIKGSKIEYDQIFKLGLTINWKVKGNAELKDFREMLESLLNHNYTIVSNDAVVMELVTLIENKRISSAKIDKYIKGVISK